MGAPLEPLQQGTIANGDADAHHPQQPSAAPSYTSGGGANGAMSVGANGAMSVGANGAMSVGATGGMGAQLGLQSWSLPSGYATVSQTNGSYVPIPGGQYLAPTAMCSQAYSQASFAGQSMSRMHTV